MATIEGSTSVEILDKFLPYLAGFSIAGVALACVILFDLKQDTEGKLYFGYYGLFISVICTVPYILTVYALFKTNQAGPGSHVCNCGYMVSTNARGKGLATSMCEHSQRIAAELGYKAMQFNFVAVTNEGAVRLWKKLGFETVGRLPMAFNHPTHGYVDALVMYKWLGT